MAILDEIERDLKAFADPGATVVVARDSAVWEQDGKEIAVRFSAGADPNGYPDVLVEGTRLPYRSFLASPFIADLGRFAEFIVKTDRRGGGFVETLARKEDEDSGTHTTEPATDLIRRCATEDLPFLSTRVLLVRGEAGAGKTIALRELTSRQADRFRRGEVPSLFFYVDAQGRALSRLEDAMAKDLQDLRSRFSYAAIAPLTRHKLIVPIIDGFDELLGSGGYDEAFSSLAAFLSTLEGEGCVVASARSAFFDYRNFRENATRFSGDGRLNYTVDTVEVLRWSHDQVRKYFQSVASQFHRTPREMTERLDAVQASLDEQNRDLFTKPFYAARVAGLLAEGWEPSSEADLLDQLVTAFLERERGKFLDKENQPLLSAKGHQAFLTALAEEMWWQESPRVDVGTVQVVAELVIESLSLPPTAATSIVERVSSYAFLSADPTQKRFLRFEHEVFYGYFLAHKLQQYIEREPNDLRRFLGRSVLEETLAEQATRLIGTDVQRCTRAVEAICSVLRTGVSEVVARENAGLLVASLIQSAKGLVEGTVIRNVVFRQVSFGKAKLARPRFENCDFSHVDVSQAQLVTPEFDQCLLQEIGVDVRRTRLQDADPSIRESIRSVLLIGGDADAPSGRRVFDPDEITEILRKLGVKRPPTDPKRKGRSPRAEKRSELVDRFLRKMEQRFYASEEDIAKFSFTADHEWQHVREMLERHGLVEEHYVQKSGPKEPLIRLAVPPEVLRRGQNAADIGVPAPVRAFWHDLLEG
jgi:hypothetical protein